MAFVSISSLSAVRIFRRSQFGLPYFFSIFYHALKKFLGFF
jgi:hypothetical protein